MRTMARFVAVVAVAVVLGVLVGCSRPGPAPGPEPVLTPLPTAPAKGADLVCGMDRESLETATGLAVGSWEGELTVRDGIGSGQCVVQPKDKSLLSGPLLLSLIHI